MRCASTRGLLVLLCPLLTLGCLYDRYTSNTKRSATEQLLVSTSVDRAVDAVALPEVDGRRVAVRVVGLGHIDKDYDDLEYVQTALEQRVLRLGGMIAKKPEAADLRMTVLVAAVGTVERHFVVGVPNFNIGIFGHYKQHGYTKLSLLTQDPSGQIVADSPFVMEGAHHEIWELMMAVWRREDIYPDERALGVD